MGDEACFVNISPDCNNMNVVIKLDLPGVVWLSLPKLCCHYMRTDKDIDHFGD